MAEIKLNTTTSIVDLMKSLGKPSDYNSRANLYKESGLADRLGSYVGSASQNTAFIKSLGTPSSTGAIEGANPNIKAEEARFATAPQGTPVKETPVDATIGTSGITAEQAQSSIPKAPSADEVLNTILNSPGFQNFQQQKDLSKELDIGTAQAERQKLETQTAQDTKQLIDSLSRHGLGLAGA